MPKPPAPPPSAAPAGDGLFSPGAVRMFGLPYTGLEIGHLGLPAGSNNTIAQAIAAGRAKPSLARIYGFSYLGNYFKLPEPVVFMVYAPGVLVDPGGTGDMAIGVVGTEYAGESFNAGVMLWTLDQLDMTVRIDVKVGWVKDLLLGEMEASNNMTGGDAVRRADLVGRDASLVGRDASMIGRNR